MDCSSREQEHHLHAVSQQEVCTNQERRVLRGLRAAQLHHHHFRVAIDPHLENKVCAQGSSEHAPRRAPRGADRNHSARHDYEEVQAENKKYRDAVTINIQYISSCVYTIDIYKRMWGIELKTLQ